MNHLDEGTIHAWLDGALDAGQSRAADEHVRGCPRCSEAVAEARGLMAASSRILGALDDVPAKVIPMTPTAKRRPMWRAAPWVTGIAAVLVAAVVLRTNVQPGAPEPLVSAPVAEVADSQRSLVESAPPAAPAVTASAAPTAPATPARVGSAQGAGAASGSRAADLASVQVSSAREAPRGEGGAARVARAATDAAIATESRDREEVLQRRALSERGQEAAAAPPPSAMAPQRSVLLDMRGVRPIDPSRDTLLAPASLAGCYQVPAGARDSFAQELTRRGAASDARRSAPAASVAPIPAGPANAMTVRLDSVLEGEGYRVMDARADTTIGWWRRLQGDSARIELQMLGVVVVLPGRDRITCPER
jgi:hypothetical protein